MFIKLYDDWWPSRDIIARPKLHFKIGRWSKDPCLPVWRRGPIIRLYNRKEPTYINPLNVNKNLKIGKVYPVIDAISYIKGKTTVTRPDGSTYECNNWGFNRHKLPGNLHYGDRVWRRDIRKKLKKWHLSWIKPTIELPIWFTFKWYNHSAYWKTTWDEIRYEYPPQLTLVLFGMSISFWLTAPESALGIEDVYWEALLDARYAKNPFTMMDFVKRGSIWSIRKNGQDILHFGFRPEYVIPDKMPQYIEAIEVFKDNSKCKDKVVL